MVNFYDASHVFYMDHRQICDTNSFNKKHQDINKRNKNMFSLLYSMLNINTTYSTLEFLNMSKTETNISKKHVHFDPPSTQKTQLYMAIEV